MALGDALELLLVDAAPDLVGVLLEVDLEVVVVPGTVQDAVAWSVCSRNVAVT